MSHQGKAIYNRNSGDHEIIWTNRSSPIGKVGPSFGMNASRQIVEWKGCKRPQECLDSLHAVSGVLAPQCAKQEFAPNNWASDYLVIGSQLRDANPNIASRTGAQEADTGIRV
jgi:hypothetical protein